MGIDYHLDIVYRTMNLEVGDVFMKTTDDIKDYLSDTKLKQLLLQAMPLQQ
jgi:hypothetical protein